MVAVVAMGAIGWTSPTRAAEHPNFVVILADDLGYSDVGCYGGEILTPTLDRMAAEGVRFTQFYNTARCWPSRAALLTGYYAQQVRRDSVPGATSGGKGTRPGWAPLLSTRLAAANYRSYHSGKWHVDGLPLANGFHRSYSLNDHGRYFSAKQHTRDDKPLPPADASSGYYATSAIADHAIECLRDHVQNHAQQPFFSFVAFTSPHFPLHALPDDIAAVGSRYAAGWDAVRKSRATRLREFGLFDGPVADPERKVGPPYDFPKAIEQLGSGEVNRPHPWSELNRDQQAFQAAKMAIHAAMVERMDREIGRIVATLDQAGVRDNTLICFMSDNGATAEIMIRDDGHDPAAPAGSAKSHLCLGPGWSTAANTPFRRHKTWVHEGGISTPLIVNWPQGIRARGELRTAPAHLVDLVPTFLELAGVSVESQDGVPAPSGRSLASQLAENHPLERPEGLWFLHEGNRAFRQGDWKIVSSKLDDHAWELYNMKNDRGETTNLAEREPERLKQMADGWELRWKEFQQQATAPQLGR